MFNPVYERELRKDLLFKAFLVGMGLAVINALAIFFYWYSTIWWFDMPMHFVGGVFSGYILVWFGLYLSSRYTSFQNKIQFFVWYLVGLGIVAVGWELFEFVLKLNTTSSGLNYIDSTSDIAFDFAGGLLVYILLSIKKLYTTTIK